MAKSQGVEQLPGESGTAEAPEAVPADGEEDAAWTEGAEERACWSNRFGSFDGRRLRLCSFPVWYSWRPVPRWLDAEGSTVAAAPGFLAKPQLKLDVEVDAGHLRTRRTTEADEAGVVSGVEFFQTMGRVELCCPLLGDDAAVGEEDLVVEMSCWELRVSTAGVEGPRRLEQVCGQLFDDIHRRLSWWGIQEDDGLGSGRWLRINLAKVRHKAWGGVWWPHPKNPHNLRKFPITNDMWQHYLSHICNNENRREEECLAAVPPGDPQETNNELMVMLAPDRLCTGVDDDYEDEHHVTVVVHLDEANLEAATAYMPLEELFGADVDEDHLEVFVRGVGFRLCWGGLNGICVPELATWEIKSVRRNVPSYFGIRAPAYYNPAIRIHLVKAESSRGLWGGAFADMQRPEYQPPRERIPWTEVVQRSMVIAPMAPLKPTVKREQAQKLCTHVECRQDLQTATIIMHLVPRLENFAGKYKVDLLTFFSMRIGERMVEISAVADCEYPMCGGWLGGPCVPERTTWELGRIGPKAQESKVVAASGGGQKLTLQEGLALQRELLDGFQRPAFRRRLKAMELEHEKGSASFKQERQQLCLTVQSRILPRYGFEGSSRGVFEMMRTMDGLEFRQSKECADLAARCNVLLGVAESGRELTLPLPELTEDKRLLGAWRFTGKLTGRHEISTDDTSRMQIVLYTLGLVMAGTVHSAADIQAAKGAKAAKAAEEAAWLRAELQTENGREAGEVLMRLDEEKEQERMELRFRRANTFQWIEGVMACREEEVLAERSEPAEQEEHLSVQLVVTKATPGQWPCVLTRLAPGQAPPDDSELQPAVAPEATKNIEV